MRATNLGRSALTAVAAVALLGGATPAGAVPDAPAADSLATEPADVPQPSAYPTSDVELFGHGYGHGRGMGQWGAYGYATEYGWSYEQIVDHYYGGTDLGTKTNTTITVRLTAQDGRALVVTSGRDFTVDDVLVDGGSAARIELRGDGQYTITPMYGCDGRDATPRVRDTSVVTSTVGNPGDDMAALLALCTSGGGTKQYRGSLSLAQFDGSPRTVNSVLMEDYLRSVVPRESPASWADSGGAPALRAQAVAARSYAYSENRYDYAKTCDTTSCQVYGGAGLNRVSQEDDRTDAAISYTANRVIVWPNGSIARAEFSSSTGGYTAGGDFPARPDAGDEVSPYHDWTDAIPVTSIQSAYGIGTLSSISVTARNGVGEDGGRAREVRIVGSTRTVVLTGDEFRLDWDLLSDWYSFEAQPPPGVTPTYHLRNALAGGPADITFGYGRPGDVALACDWDGNGTDTPGVFRAGTFYLRNSNSSGVANITVDFGQAGDVPLCGDWDSDGVDTVGIYRGRNLQLRNSNTSGSAEISTSYGRPGDVPVMGDWNGDGYDTIAVVRGATWYLSDSNRYPVTSYTLVYGVAGDQPLAGDWTGSGLATPGIRRGTTFYLRTALTSGPADVVFGYGTATDRGIVGDWDGPGGTDSAGVTRNY